MEAAGLYASATRAKLDWIVVKGVSDWGDGKSTKNTNSLLPLRHAALLILFFLTRTL